MNEVLQTPNPPTTPPVWTLPVLPIKNTVLFPHMFLPLSVGRPTSRAAVEAALASEDKTLIIVTQKDPLVEQPTKEDLYPIATRAIIKKMARNAEGMELLVQGQERVELLSLEQVDQVLRGTAQGLSPITAEGTETEALQRAVIEATQRVLDLANPEAAAGLPQMVAQAGGDLHLIYLLASMMNLDVPKEEAILQANTQNEALKLLLEHLNHEAQVLEVRNQITQRAHSEISKEQRDYILRRQLQAIREELGDEESVDAEIENLRQRLYEANLPDEVRKETERELNRLERMSPASPDYQLTRSYLELVLELPWNKSTEDTIDLPNARRVLDEDHYNLKEIKDRILEHLAVLKLNPKAKAPILCFVGPPGVGKTSLGQSIARSMGRTFERVSLGGMHDEAELRGHRRTYIGAMPGRIIQAIRKAGVKNPVLMLDELDKLGRDYRGDPSAALLEILDPAQNHTFRDNYLNLPFDLSNVFFIATANTLETIPRPLLDRLEILPLTGYSEEEKREIAKRYLIPRQLNQNGLKEGQLHLPEETLKHVITRYTREAGVRQLEQMIGRLARKVAARFAEGRTESVTIGPEDLSEFLGPERISLERARKELPSGVSTGLAWTEAGGDVLYIEASLLPYAKSFRLTGQLGKVMKESAKTAHSYVWGHAEELGIDVNQFRHRGIHVHVPAGAVPKDGPSAGIALVTALTSIYTGLPARSDTAMTGEVTLTGLVMPIGGVKEKVLAARRAGINRVILPKDNAKDLRELPEQVRKEMQIILVENVGEVLAATIPGLPRSVIA